MSNRERIGIVNRFPMNLEQRKHMARAFGGVDAILYQVVYDHESLNLYYPCIAKAGGNQQQEDIVRGGICTNIRWVCDPAFGLYTLELMEKRIGCKLQD